MCERTDRVPSQPASQPASQCDNYPVLEQWARRERTLAGSASRIGVLLSALELRDWPLCSGDTTAIAVDPCSAQRYSAVRSLAVSKVCQAADGRRRRRRRQMIIISYSRHSASVVVIVESASKSVSQSVSQPALR